MANKTVRRIGVAVSGSSLPAASPASLPSAEHWPDRVPPAPALRK